MTDDPFRFTTDPNEATRIRKSHDELRQIGYGSVEMVDGKTHTGIVKRHHFSDNVETGRAHRFGGYLQMDTEKGLVSLDLLDIKSWKTHGWENLPDWLMKKITS